MTKQLKDTDIIESADIVELEEADLKGSRYRVRLIEGDRLGSTGYYPAETLRRDGPKIFTKGTPMYLDHQTPSEKNDRPYGSVTTFAGELAEDAFYEGDGLYADIEVFEHQRPLIKSLKDKIGISIRARGRSITESINGKLVPVFQELVSARSADFVVRAGAGGKIVSILESAVESESASDIEERENMEKEVLEAIESLKTDVLARLTTLEEAAKPVVEKVVEEAAVDFDKVLEIAEALGSSKLDAVGRQRVLDLHKANGKPLAELITAEEAYVKTATAAATEEEGIEESEQKEIEESANATPKVPSFWSTKKVN